MASNLALGIDPSKTCTGIALVSVHPVTGGMRVIEWTATIRKPEVKAEYNYAKLQSVWMDLQDFMDGELMFNEQIKSVACEKAFNGTEFRSGLDVAFPGGLVSGFFLAKLGIHPILMTPNSWRSKVYRDSGLKRDEWKTAARNFASVLPGYNERMSIDVCEAIGIAGAGAVAQAGITKGVKR